MRRIFAIIVLLLPIVTVVLVEDISLVEGVQGKGQIMNEETNAVPTHGVKKLTITVIYDNNPCKQGSETAWGFAASITGAEKTILFDTGGDGSLLLNNMQKSEIEPNSIDTVVLSHIHGDHTGGLGSFLEKNPNVTVYLPKSFPKRFKDGVQALGAKIVDVNEPMKICENVYSTGQLGEGMIEQSLIIRTGRGLIVITGCAHPGIEKIVNAAKDFLKENILLVMGGFHLAWESKGKIEKIISAFKQCHMRYVGPCHCSGDKARNLFEKHFGKNYINIGVGKVITLDELQ